MKYMADNRWGCRRDIALNILIYYQGTPVAKCRSSNISRSGMFVETGPLTFFRNTSLEVEFKSGNDARKKIYRLPATVIYSSSKGIGVMFDTAFMPRISHKED